MKSIFGVVILVAISGAAQAQGVTNTEIIRLRALYQDLASRAADIAARVGPNHLAVVKVRERMDDLRKQILGRGAPNWGGRRPKGFKIVEILQDRIVATRDVLNRLNSLT